MKIKLFLSSLETRDNPSGPPVPVVPDEDANPVDPDICYFEGSIYAPGWDSNPMLLAPPVDAPPLTGTLGDGDPTLPNAIAVTPPINTTPDTATLPNGD